jgi:hypothetical protein
MDRESSLTSIKTPIWTILPSRMQESVLFQYLMIREKEKKDKDKKRIIQIS